MKEKETICGPTYSIRSQGTNLIRDIYPSQCSFIYSNLALNGDPRLIHDTMIIKESGLGGGRMMFIYFTVLSIISNMTSNASHHRSLPRILRPLRKGRRLLHGVFCTLRCGVYLPTLSSHRLRSPHAPSSHLSLLPRPFDPLDVGLVALEFLHRSRLISAPQAVPR